MSNTIILATAKNLVRLTRTLNLDPMNDSDNQLVLLHCFRNMVDMLQINGEHAEHIEPLMELSYKASNLIGQREEPRAELSELYEQINDLWLATFDNN